MSSYPSQADLDALNASIRLRDSLDAHNAGVPAASRVMQIKGLLGQLGHDNLYDALTEAIALKSVLVNIADEAKRWRAVKARYSVKLCRLITGSTSYSSDKAPAMLDAWADMAHAEMDAFDRKAWIKEITADRDAREARGERGYEDET